MTTKTIGQEIQAYCGKCKDITIHLITAMQGENVDKVMCKHCLSYHKFRLAGSKPSVNQPTKSVSKTSKDKTMKTRRTKTAKLLEAAVIEDAVAYKMSNTYEADEAIHHKKFGLGIVKNILDDQKITVLFEDGERVLVQNIH